jgi:hypothetical protein
MPETNPHGTPLPNRRREAFCRLFVFGFLEGPGDGNGREGEPDPRHNATQAYIAAGYQPNSLLAASVSASRLLRNDKVRQRIEELRTAEDRLVSALLRRWISLLPDAQKVLMDAMAGEEVTSVQFKAALAVIDRAEGRPGRGRRSREAGEDHPPCIVTIV